MQNKEVHSVCFFSTISCFLCVYFFHKCFFNGGDNTLIIAAFGATAVLTFSKELKKYSYKTMFLGSLVAGLIGVTMNYTRLDIAFKIALAIGFCILFMNLTKLSYPPGGAIVLIPLIPNKEIQELGYLYVLYPTLTGTTIIYFFSKIQQKLI